MRHANKTRRERRKAARIRTKGKNTAIPNGNQTIERVEEDKELIQALTVQLDRGFRFTGAYVWLQMKRLSVDNFLKQV